MSEPTQPAGQTSTAQSESLTDADIAQRPGSSSDGTGASGLSLDLQALREVLTEVLPHPTATEHRGELTVEVAPDDLLEALRSCKDDERIACELLSDVSAVHWPGGVITENDQETTGWPTFTERKEDGTFDVNYVLRSVGHGHWFRLRTVVTDVDPHLPSATSLWRSATMMEREVFDMAGITFDGHPALTRVLMPEDWDGHPHRKDYPLGGVEVMYKGETVPPPDERDY